MTKEEISDNLKISRRDGMRVLGYGSLAFLLYACLPEADRWHGSGALTELLYKTNQAAEYSDDFSQGFNVLVEKKRLLNEVLANSSINAEKWPNNKVGIMATINNSTGIATAVFHPLGTDEYIGFVENPDSEPKVLDIGILNGKENYIDSVVPLKDGSFGVLDRSSLTRMPILTDTGDKSLDERFRSVGRMSSDRRAILLDGQYLMISGIGSCEKVELIGLNSEVRVKNAMFVNTDENMIVLNGDKVFYPVSGYGDDNIVLASQSIKSNVDSTRYITLEMSINKLKKINLPVRHVTNKLELSQLHLDDVDGKKVVAALYMGNPGEVIYPWIQITKNDIYEHTEIFR